MANPVPALQSVLRHTGSIVWLLIHTIEEIGDATPLFDEGLGLDSIDVLELVLEIERSFGVSIGDEQTGMKVLRSVDTIADYITSERARSSA